MFSSDFTDTCACESFTASGSVRSLSSDVVVLRDELGSLEGIESNRSAADSITNVDHIGGRRMFSSRDQPKTLRGYAKLVAISLKG